MYKWNEEKILYFASKPKGFEVDKEAETQKKLRRMVGDMKKRGLLKGKSSSMFKRIYETTEKGSQALIQYQKEYNGNKKEEAKNATNKTDKDYHVYFGYDRNNTLVYIGTTIQKPRDRWRWHKSNGKDLRFELHKTLKDKDAMLNLEFELIKKHKPRLNKITNRPQNLNVKLSKAELDSRKGDKEWCQSCLKRRAKKGSYCGYCLN